MIFCLYTNITKYHLRLRYVLSKTFAMLLLCIISI